MEGPKLFSYGQRKLFQPEYACIRWILVFSSFILSAISYIYYNLFTGSFSLFMMIYFMGGFKTRQRIEVFLNAHPASIANEITNLFNSAREELKIFSGFLDPEIYCHPDVSHALDMAIKRGVKVFVVTDYNEAIKEECPGENNHTIMEGAKNNRIQLFDFGQEINKMNHFIIADRRSFRLEAIHTDNAELRKAITAYNNKRAEKLLIYFDRIVTKGAAKRVYPKEGIKLC